MKILFLAHYVDLYGANRSLLTLLDGLRNSSGCECHVVVPRQGAITEELERLGIGYTMCELPWWFVKKKELLYQRGSHGRIRTILSWWRRELRAMAMLEKIVRASRADLIHSNSAVLATGMLLARRIGKPHVWHLREYATLDYDLHPFIGPLLARMLIRSSAGVVCVSASIQDHFKIPRRKNVRVIYNGVASEAFMKEHERTLEKARDTFTFCMVGVVARTKGHSEAVRALAIVVKKWPGVRLEIIGGGSVKEIKELVDELHLSMNVMFHGYVKEVFPLLERSDALLMCSRNEAMGRVTAEAMCIGVPVIGHRSGGTTELIEDGMNGLLYSGSEIELAECMLRMIEDDRLYAHLSRNALKKAQESFTNENYVASVKELYEDLLKG